MAAQPQVAGAAAAAQTAPAASTDDVEVRPGTAELGGDGAAAAAAAVGQEEQPKLRRSGVISRALPRIERMLARDEYVTQLHNDEGLRADPDLRSRYTPLMPHPLPVSYERFAAERVMRRVAVLDPKDRVMAAVASREPWVVEELFMQGCPVMTKCQLGYTPLHASAAYGDAQTVRVLLNMGVDVNPTSINGTTPLASAVATGGRECVCAVLLRRAGAQLEGVGVAHPLASFDLLGGSPQRVRRVMDDNAVAAGRRVPYYGQF